MMQLKAIIFVGMVSLFIFEEAVGLEHIGCYQDGNDRDLDGVLIRDYDNNTPQFCDDICANNGYWYSGVQNGYACLCGNSYGKYGGPISVSRCQEVACTGDSSIFCGGGFANDIFKVANPAKATCTVHGDPHLNTFDDKKYMVHGNVPCEHYLVKHNDFEIIGKLTKCHTTRTCLSWVKIISNGNTWILGQNGVVTDGSGTPLSLPITSPITIQEVGSKVVATLFHGVVTWDGKKNAEIRIIKSYKNKLEGLFGDFDGNADNDEAGVRKINILSSPTQISLSSIKEDLSLGSHVGLTRRVSRCQSDPQDSFFYQSMTLM